MRALASCLTCNYFPIRKRRASTHYIDAYSGDPSSLPSSRVLDDPAKSRHAVDDVTKRSLVRSLKETLLMIERHLILRDSDLESQLEEADYQVDRAASEFIERAGLRQIVPNSTLKKIRAEDDSPSQVNRWSACSPSTFRVRVGPNYRKSRTKRPAEPPALYDTIAFDVFASEEKEEHISRFMKLGDLEVDDASALPQLFIINFMLPLDEPKLSSMINQTAENSNGRTLSFHVIMRISEWTKNNVSHPSVQLLSRFLRECGDGQPMRERLKIIVQVANPDELNMNPVERGMYNKCNGLPFCYREYNSSYVRGAGWFQAAFDGHRSGYTTRLSRYALLGLCNRIVANVAFVVEAETDDELPERVLGCLNVHRIRVNTAAGFIRPVATPLLSPSRSKAAPAHIAGLSSLDDDDERSMTTV